MNKELEELVAGLQDDFVCEIHQDENRDYRRGYYAGALYAALMIKEILTRSEDVK